MTTTFGRASRASIRRHAKEMSYLQGRQHAMVERKRKELNRAIGTDSPKKEIEFLSSIILKWRKLKEWKNLCIAATWPHYPVHLSVPFLSSSGSELDITTKTEEIRPTCTLLGNWKKNRKSKKYLQNSTQTALEAYLASRSTICSKDSISTCRSKNLTNCITASKPTLRNSTWRSLSNVPSVQSPIRFLRTSWTNYNRKILVTCPNNLWKW